MNDVAVVHLVRKANGIGPLERFLESYRRHPAGERHDLVLVFKGFGRNGEAGEEYDRVLDAVGHQRLFLPDRGLDIRPYFTVVSRYNYRYFCFVNSFSRVAAPNWLEKLYRHLAQPGVGLVSATASYQSFAQTHAERSNALGGLDPISRVRSRARYVASAGAPRVVAQRAGAWMLGALGVWKPARHFPAFPNYHIRTNGFMARRDVLEKVRVGPMLFKLSAFMFESGRESMTRQIMRLGLRALVVDSRGSGFEKEEWHLSDTYRQARQENLLIADNQTDAYDDSAPEQRANLSRIAWGRYARPA